MSDEQAQKGVFKDEETQEMLNKPVSGSLEQEDEKLMNLILSMLHDGRIQPHVPSSLMNSAVYEGLSDADKGKVDMEAFNMLSAIREIQDLDAQGNRESEQMKYTVRRLRLNKERIEGISGDVFII